MSTRKFASQITELNSCVVRIGVISLQEQLDRAIGLLSEVLVRRRPLLVCRNGASAADAQHIARELVGKFVKERRAVNVCALTTDSSVMSAWANDVSYETIFARQV